MYQESIKQLFQWALKVAGIQLKRAAVLLLPDAPLAQWAARQSHNLKVVSSSLTGGTDFFCTVLLLFFFGN